MCESYLEGWDDCKEEIIELLKKKKEYKAIRIINGGLEDETRNNN